LRDAADRVALQTFVVEAKDRNLHSANAEDVVVSKANKPAIASLSSLWLSALAIGLH
jgi:hypothetical protein